MIDGRWARYWTVVAHEAFLEGRGDYGRVSQKTEGLRQQNCEADEQRRDRPSRAAHIRRLSEERVWKESAFNKEECGGGICWLFKFFCRFRGAKEERTKKGPALASDRPVGMDDDKIDFFLLDVDG